MGIENERVKEMEPIFKYPRTQHLETSCVQSDDIKETVPISKLKGLIVVEEKMDGANSGISFSSSGELLLQSRGHYLTGGPRERQFELFKSWAMRWRQELYEILRDQYVMYGEWMYAKHTVYYDALPHYFMEFDIYEKKNGIFLSTKQRHKMLEGSPITSVKVVGEGTFDHVDELWGLVTKSNFKSAEWRNSLYDECRRQDLDPGIVVKQTQNDDLMEGLYIKTEDEYEVTGRFKLVRPQFLATIADSETHWMSRPIVPNQLASDVDIFS